MEPADLADAEVPDAENRALPIRTAIALIVEDRESYLRRCELEWADPRAFTPPLSPEEIALLRADAAANAATLRAFADVDGRASVNWHDAGRVRFDLDDDAIGGTRAIAGLLSDQVLLANLDRRDAAAFVAIRRLRSLAEAVAEMRSIATSYVAMGIYRSAAERLTDVAPTLVIDDGLRPVIVAAIAAELDAGPIDRLMRQGLWGDRVFQRAWLAAIRNGRSPGGKSQSTVLEWCIGRLYAPLLYRGEATLLDYMQATLDLADATSRRQFDSSSGERRRIEAAARSDRINPFLAALFPRYDRFFQTRFYLLTDRHLAATALALRLYRADHAGRPPATLTALVPDYLPAVPIDPIDGQPLRYDATRAILWSVGDDGTDDGGDATPIDSERPPGWWAGRDAFVRLEPSPATRPSR